MKLKTTVCIERRKEEVWKYLSDITNVDLWVETIKSAHCDGEQKSGVGTVRVCALDNGKIATEEYTQWDEGNGYTYKAVAIPMPMVALAQNAWSVEAIDGKSLVTSNATLVFKGGIFGKLFGLAMRYMFKKEMRGYMASLKYLVENGEPYSGKISKLGFASSVC